MSFDLAMAAGVSAPADAAPPVEAPVMARGAKTETATLIGATTENLSDLGNAKRLWRLHGQDVRWIKAFNTYYVFDGRLWREDSTEQLARWAEDVLRDLHRTAAEAPSRAAREAAAGWALTSESAGRIHAMIDLLRGQPDIAVLAEIFDADPWLLSCPNGVLNLRTLDLRPHARTDYVTKMTAAPYDPTAQSAIWRTFLTDNVPDAGTIGTLQRAAGYSLTGDIRHEQFFFVHGPAGSGKSTFLEALKRTLGDYAGTANFETFLAGRRTPGAADDDRADLRGLRHVSAVETIGRRDWADGIVKLFTGGDTIKARHVYERLFAFVPQFKLWLAANERPRVPASAEGFWRRILEVPFPHARPEARQRDPEVKAALTDPATSGPAILAWCVAGCGDWRRDGHSLRVSETIEASTRRYRESQDSVAQFLDARCLLGPTGSTRPAVLRAAYLDWCKEQDLKPTTGDAWTGALAAQKIDLARPAPTAPRRWVGVTLLPDHEHEAGPPF
jgi:putative DNA primase/helicase